MESISLIWTGIVFLTGQVIFVPEWPKGEFVSFCVGYILLDKITIMYCS
jgi:predicted RNA-binding protein with TRAM domain